MSASRVATLPFEHLPNLPKAVIPTVELELDPINWNAVRFEADSSVEGLERVRTYTADRTTQTDETELGEVKEVARVLDELLEVCSGRKCAVKRVYCPAGVLYHRAKCISRGSSLAYCS